MTKKTRHISEYVKDHHPKPPPSAGVGAYGMWARRVWRDLERSPKVPEHILKHRYDLGRSELEAIVQRYQGGGA